MSEADKSQTVETEVVEEVPPLPAWNCRVQKDNTDEAAELDSLYVGDKYLLRCEGPFVEGIDGKVQLRPKEEVDEYAIAILEMRDPISIRIDHFGRTSLT